MKDVPTAEAQAALDMFAAQERLSAGQPPSRPIDALAEWRRREAAAINLQGVAPDLHDIADIVVSGPDEAVRMRIYRPAPGVLPAIMYMHGGGFTAGSIESIDTTLRNLAKLTGWLVASVEYRLAPEHPYPAAPEDCYAAFLHLASRASSLNIDPARIVVAGESAGGLLAAVVALQARDRRGPRLAGFVCLYPLTDLRDQCSYPSMAEHDGNVFHIRDLRGFLNLYLPPGVDRSQATVSPGLAADLSGLPPALIVSCDFDPIRDEGRVFARRLSEAGVAVDAINMPGMIHAVMPLAGLLPEAYAQMITHIRSFLGRHVPAGTSAG